MTRAKVKRLSGESLGKLRIPVPPPEIQREIVRVLDTLEELEADLKWSWKRSWSPPEAVRVLP